MSSKFINRFCRGVLLGFLLIISQNALSGQCPSLYFVTSTLDNSAPGTLRDAIECANAGFTKFIYFNIQGNGPHVIQLNSPLPSISLSSNDLVIDATTFSNWYSGKYVIDGGDNISSGLIIQSDRVDIYGLEIRNFTDSGIRVLSTSVSTEIGGIDNPNRLVDNRIGIQIEGDLINVFNNVISENTDYGVMVTATSNASFIGGLIPDFANRIINNGIAGVFLTSVLTTNSRILGNIFRCNGEGIILNPGANGGVQPPVITYFGLDEVRGTAGANDRVEVYIYEPNAFCINTNALGQGNIFLGTVNSDAAGNWTLPASSYAITILDTDAVVATTTDFGGLDIPEPLETSEFSAPFFFDCNANDTEPPTLICNSTVTVALDFLGEATVTPDDFIVDQSDNCELGSSTVTPNTFNCNDIGVNTVTVTVFDEAGNFSECISTLVVVDQDAPDILSCPGPNSIIDVTLGTDGTAILLPLPISENCSVQSSGFDQGTFDCSDIGSIIPVTFQATDNSNNISRCFFQVNVLDEINPVAICQDITVSLDDQGSAIITADDVDGGSTDNCSISSLSVFPRFLDCDDLANSPVSVQLTVIDSSGNRDSCEAFVTVLDEVPPILDCITAIDLSLDASGQAFLSPSDILISSSDNCDLNLDFNLSQDIFNCSNTTPVIVELEGIDDRGNTGNCFTTINVFDQIAPTVTCQPATVQLDANGQGTLFVSQVLQDSSDNCGILSVDISQTDFSCVNIGPNNVVTLTVRDAAGNEAECFASVIVEDNIDPTPLCQPLTITLTDSGPIVVAPTQIDNGSFDNCSAVDLSLSPNTFDCSNIGDNIVTLTVTDAFGNEATCDATITIEDSAPPIAICQPGPILLFLFGSTASLDPTQVDNGSFDNCGPLSFSLDRTNFSCADLGADIPVTLTVTDGANLSDFCVTTVTLLDIDDPVANCQDIMVYLDENGEVDILPEDVDDNSTDNCGIISYSLSDSTFTCMDIGPNTVRLRVEDGSNLVDFCSATVTVLDTLPPVAQCKDITVQLDENDMAVILPSDIDSLSSDNCGIDSMFVFPDTLGIADLGENEVILTVIDSSGNQDTCISIVTLEDTGVTARCQDTIVYLDTLGMAIITPDFINKGSSAFDGIDTILVDPDTLSCFLGDTVVHLIVIDSLGEADTCRALVSVMDTLPPIAVCKDTTLFLDVSGVAMLNPEDLDGGSTDNCGIDSLGISKMDFDCTDIGQDTVWLLVMDTAGLVDSCFALVTVIDTIAPTAICQDFAVTLDDNGNASIDISDIDFGSTDNCSGIDTSFLSQTDFDCSDIGQNTVTLTVLDNNGLMSTCEATVTVNSNFSTDITGNLFICEGDSTTLTASGGGTYLWNNGETNSSILVNPAMTTTYVVTVTDDNGCTAIDSATVEVLGLPSLIVDTVACTGDFSIYEIEIISNADVVLSTLGDVMDNGGGSFTITNVPIGQEVNITATNSSTACSTNTDVLLEDCSCGVEAPISGGDTTICAGEPLPTLMVNVQTDETANWYDENGVRLASGTTSFDPPAAGTFFAEAQSTIDTNCVSSTQTPVTLAILSLPNFILQGDTLICQGESSTLEVIGGNNWLWNTGSTENSITVQPATTTTYVVTVTGANGCVQTDNITVQVVEFPTLIIDTVGCKGDFTIYEIELTSNAEVVTASLGNILDNGGGSFTITNIPIGQSVFISATNSAADCTSSTDVLLEDCSCGVDAPISGGDETICAGEPLPTLTAIVQANETVNWYDENGVRLASGTTNFDPLTGGTFFAEAQSTVDTNCVSSNQTPVTLTILPLPDISLNGDTIICVGESTTLEVVGGNNVLWSTGATENPIVVQPTSTTTYSVIVSDSNGCIQSDSITIQVLELPEITIGEIACGDNETTYLVELTTDADQIITTLGNVEDNGGGSFTIFGVPIGQEVGITATNSSTSCSSDTTALLEECNCVVAAPIVTTDEQSICEGEPIPSFTADVEADETVNWYDENGTRLASGTNLFTPPGEGTYFAEAQGLADTSCISDTRTPVSLTILPLPDFILQGDTAICDGEPAILQVEGGDSWLWSTGSTESSIEVQPEINTTYSVMVIAANGCTGTAEITVRVGMPPTIDPAVTPSTCGLANGAIDLNVSGTPPFSFEWSNGSQVEDLIGISAGDYVVTVTDGIGCETVSGFGFQDSGGPSVQTFSTIDDNCGLGEGAIDITIQGGQEPYTYNWSNGSTEEDQNDLMAGEYILTVTDDNNCSRLDTFTVLGNSPISIEIIEVINASCGLSNGRIDVEIKGGTPPYNIFWSNGESTEDIENLAAGSYTLGISDINDCVATTGLDIIQTGQPGILGEISIACNPSDGTGTLSFQISGGIPPYNIIGLNGALNGVSFESNSINDDQAYNFVIEDATGCQSTQITGTVECGDCITFAGEMSDETLSECSSQPIIADVQQGAILDDNDSLIYVLHNNGGPALGGFIFATNAEPSFSFDDHPALQINTTYFISAIAGNAIGNGGVDLNDPCLSVAAGQPIVFTASPTQPIELQVSDTILCPGASLELLTNFQETGIQYSWSTPMGDTITSDPLLVIDPFEAAYVGEYSISAKSGECLSKPFGPINVQLDQQVGAVSAGEDTVLCGEDNIILEGTLPEFASGQWTTNTGATIFNPNQSTTFVEDLFPSRNRFVWTVTSTTCIVSDTVFVEYVPRPIANDVSLILNEDKEVGLFSLLANDDLRGIDSSNISIELLTQPDYDDFIINPDGSIVISRDEDQTEPVDFNFDYLVCNNTEFCQVCDTATANVQVLYNELVAIFPDGAFSPPGNNPDWGFTVARPLREATLYIGDRWGRIVLQRTLVGDELQKGRRLNVWDGSRDNERSENLPAGAYYFWLEGKATEELPIKQNGIIYLVR